MFAGLLSYACNCGAIFGVALMTGSGGLALWELDLPRQRLPIELPGDGAESGKRAVSKLETAAVSEELAATYEGVFRATVYYTPTECGFSREDGFDMTPVTKPGLAGKKFPRDFLKAVEMEGFGRMKSPVEGKQYVRCAGGQWGFSGAPLDRCGQPLQALRSTAISTGHKMIQPNANFRVQAEGLPAEFSEARWLVCDTGGGLKERQIDFYWGEDVPLGPGAQLSRPRGLPQPISNPTILVLR